jgi:sugar/nucleoside kinase (ribokinase family)
VHFALVPRHCRDWLPILERLRRRGATTSWDFGWHELLLADPAFPQLLASVDWIFVNEREATFYTRTRTLPAAMRSWRDRTRGTVVKLGARGVTVLGTRSTVRVTAPKVRAVDTTGAGDSFNGGFLAARLADGSLRAAARLGNYIGARNVRAPGGIDGLPHRDELPAWARRILDGR